MSISLKFWKELQEHGADDLVKRVYGNFITAVEPGMYTTLDYRKSRVAKSDTKVGSRRTTKIKNLVVLVIILVVLILLSYYIYVVLVLILLFLLVRER